MATKLQPGMTIPDFELPDENGEMHTLSELQRDNPMILLLGRMASTAPASASTRKS